MYKFLFNNLSRSRHYLNSFTRSYKRVAQNQKYNLFRTCAEAKSQSQSNVCSNGSYSLEKTASDPTIGSSRKFERQVKSFTSLSRKYNQPALIQKKSKPKIRLVTYSTNSRKLFYSSLVNCTKYGTYSPKKKPFLNKEAVEFYKSALKQCNRIKLRKRLENTLYQPRELPKVKDKDEERQLSLHTSELESKYKAHRKVKRAIKVFPFQIKSAAKSTFKSKPATPKVPPILKLVPRVVIKKDITPKKKEPYKFNALLSLNNVFNNKKHQIEMTDEQQVEIKKIEEISQARKDRAPSLGFKIYRKLEPKTTKRKKLSLNKHTLQNIIRKKPPRVINLRGEPRVTFRYALEDKNRSTKEQIAFYTKKRPDKKNKNYISKIIYPANSHIKQFSPRKDVKPYWNNSYLAKIVSLREEERKQETSSTEPRMQTDEPTESRDDIRDHPTFEKITTEDRMELKKNYAKLLRHVKPNLKLTKLLQRQSSKEQQAENEDEEQSEEQNRKDPSEDPIEEPDVIIINNVYDKPEQKILTHPTVMGDQDDTDIRVKYPKKILSEAMPTFNIEETCLKLNNSKTTVIDNYIPLRDIEEDNSDKETKHTETSKKIKSHSAQVTKVAEGIKLKEVPNIFNKIKVNNQAQQNKFTRADKATKKREVPNFLDKINKEIEKVYVEDNKNEENKNKTTEEDIPLFKKLLKHYQKLDDEVTSKLRERNAKANSLERQKVIKPVETTKINVSKSSSLDRKKQPTHQLIEVYKKEESLDRKAASVTSKTNMNKNEVKLCTQKQNEKIKLQISKKAKALKNVDVKWPTFTDEEKKIYDDILKKVEKQDATPIINKPLRAPLHEKNEEPLKRKDDVFPKAEDLEETIAGEIKATILRINERKHYVPSRIHPSELESVEQKRSGSPDRNEEKKMSATKIVWPKAQDIEKNLSKEFKEKVATEVQSRAKLKKQNIATNAIPNEKEFIEASVTNINALKDITQSCLMQVKKVVSEINAEGSAVKSKKSIAELKKQQIIEGKDRTGKQDQSCKKKISNVVPPTSTNFKEPMCRYSLKVVQVENIGLKLFKESINKLKNSLTENKLEKSGPIIVKKDTNVKSSASEEKLPLQVNDNKEKPKRKSSSNIDLSKKESQLYEFLLRNEIKSSKSEIQINNDQKEKKKNLNTIQKYEENKLKKTSNKSISSSSSDTKIFKYLMKTVPKTVPPPPWMPSKENINVKELNTFKKDVKDKNKDSKQEEERLSDSTINKQQPFAASKTAQIKREVSPNIKQDLKQQSKPSSITSKENTVSKTQDKINEQKHKELKPKVNMKQYNTETPQIARLMNNTKASVVQESKTTDEKQQASMNSNKVESMNKRETKDEAYKPNSTNQKTDIKSDRLKTAAMPQKVTNQTDQNDVKIKTQTKVDDKYKEDTKIVARSIKEHPCSSMNTRTRNKTEKQVPNVIEQNAESKSAKAVASKQQSVKKEKEAISKQIKHMVSSSDAKKLVPADKTAAKVITNTTQQKSNNVKFVKSKSCTNLTKDSVQPKSKDLPIFMKLKANAQAQHQNIARFQKHRTLEITGGYKSERTNEFAITLLDNKINPQQNAKRSKRNAQEVKNATKTKTNKIKATRSKSCVILSTKEKQVHSKLDDSSKDISIKTTSNKQEINPEQSKNNAQIKLDSTNIKEHPTRSKVLRNAPKVSTRQKTEPKSEKNMPSESCAEKTEQMKNIPHHHQSNKQNKTDSNAAKNIPETKTNNVQARRSKSVTNLSDYSSKDISIKMITNKQILIPVHNKNNEPQNKLVTANVREQPANSNVPKATSGKPSKMVSFQQESELKTARNTVVDKQDEKNEKDLTSKHKEDAVSNNTTKRYLNYPETKPVPKEPRKPRFRPRSQELPKRTSTKNDDAKKILSVAKSTDSVLFQKHVQINEAPNKTNDKAPKKVDPKNSADKVPNNFYHNMTPDARQKLKKREISPPKQNIEVFKKDKPAAKKEPPQNIEENKEKLTKPNTMMLQRKLVNELNANKAFSIKEKDREKEKNLQTPLEKTNPSAQVTPKERIKLMDLNELNGATNRPQVPQTTRGVSPKKKEQNNAPSESLERVKNEKPPLVLQLSSEDGSTSKNDGLEENAPLFNEEITSVPSEKEDLDSINAGNKQYVPPRPPPPPPAKNEKDKKEKPKSNKDMVLPPRSNRLDSGISEKHEDNPKKIEIDDDKTPELNASSQQTNDVEHVQVESMSRFLPNVSLLNYKRLGEEVYKIAKNYFGNIVKTGQEQSVGDQPKEEIEKMTEATFVEEAIKKETQTKKVWKPVDEVFIAAEIKESESVNLRNLAKDVTSKWKEGSADARSNMNALRTTNMPRKKIKRKNEEYEDLKKNDGYFKKANQETKFLNTLRQRKYAESTRTLEEFEKSASFNIKFGGRYEVGSDTTLSRRIGNLDNNFRIPQYSDQPETWWSKCEPKANIKSHQSLPRLESKQDIFKDTGPLLRDTSKSSAVFKIKPSGTYELVKITELETFTEPTEEAFKNRITSTNLNRVSNSKYCLDNYEEHTYDRTEPKVYESFQKSKYLLENFEGENLHPLAEQTLERDKENDGRADKNLGNKHLNKKVKAKVCEILELPEKFSKVNHKQSESVLDIRSDFSMLSDPSQFAIFKQQPCFSDILSEKAKIVKIYDRSSIDEIMLDIEKEKQYKKFNKKLGDDLKYGESINDLFSGADKTVKKKKGESTIQRKVNSNTSTQRHQIVKSEISSKSHPNLVKNYVSKPKMVVNITLPKIQVPDRLKPRVEEVKKSYCAEKAKAPLQQKNTHQEKKVKILTNSLIITNKTTDRKQKHTKSNSDDSNSTPTKNVRSNDAVSLPQKKDIKVNDQYLSRRQRVFQTYARQAKIVPPSIMSERDFQKELRVRSEQILDPTAYKLHIQSYSNLLRNTKSDIKQPPSANKNNRFLSDTTDEFNESKSNQRQEKVLNAGQRQEKKDDREDKNPKDRKLVANKQLSLTEKLEDNVKKTVSESVKVEENKDRNNSTKGLKLVPNMQQPLPGQLENKVKKTASENLKVEENKENNYSSKVAALVSKLQQSILGQLEDKLKTRSSENLKLEENSKIKKEEKLDPNMKEPGKLEDKLKKIAAENLKVEDTLKTRSSANLELEQNKENNKIKKEVKQVPNMQQPSPGKVAQILKKIASKNLKVEDTLKTRSSANLELEENKENNKIKKEVKLVPNMQQPSPGKVEHKLRKIASENLKVEDTLKTRSSANLELEQNKENNKIKKEVKLILNMQQPLPGKFEDKLKKIASKNLKAEDKLKTSSSANLKLEENKENNKIKKEVKLVSNMQQPLPGKLEDKLKKIASENLKAEDKLKTSSSANLKLEENKENNKIKKEVKLILNMQQPLPGKFEDKLKKISSENLKAEDTLKTRYSANLKLEENKENDKIKNEVKLVSNMQQPLPGKFEDKLKKTASQNSIANDSNKVTVASNFQQSLMGQLEEKIKKRSKENLKLEENNEINKSKKEVKLVPNLQQSYPRQLEDKLKKTASANLKAEENKEKNKSNKETLVPNLQQSLMGQLLEDELKKTASVNRTVEPTKVQEHKLVKKESKEMLKQEKSNAKTLETVLTNVAKAEESKIKRVKDKIKIVLYGLNGMEDIRKREQESSTSTIDLNAQNQGNEHLKEAKHKRSNNMSNEMKHKKCNKTVKQSSTDTTNTLNMVTRSRTASDICKLCLPNTSITKCLNQQPNNAQSTYDLPLSDKINTVKPQQDPLAKYRHLKITYIRLNSREPDEEQEVPALTLKKLQEEKSKRRLNKSFSEEDIKTLTLRFEVLRKLHEEFTKSMTSNAEYFGNTKAIDSEEKKFSLKGKGRRHPTKGPKRKNDKTNDGKNNRKMSTSLSRHGSKKDCENEGKSGETSNVKEKKEEECNNKEKSVEACSSKIEEKIEDICKKDDDKKEACSTDQKAVENSENAKKNEEISAEAKDFDIEKEAPYVFHKPSEGLVESFGEKYKNHTYYKFGPHSYYDMHNYMEKMRTFSKGKEGRGADTKNKDDGCRD